MRATQQYYLNGNGLTASQAEGFGSYFPHDQIANEMLVYNSWGYKGNQDGLSFMRKYAEQSMNSGAGFVVGSGISEALDFLTAATTVALLDSRRVMQTTQYRINWNFLQENTIFDQRWITQDPISALMDDWYMKQATKGAKK